MSNRVILHLGVHKTGTTSIQRTLYDRCNWDNLVAAGVHYVRALGENHSEFFQSAFSEYPEMYHSNRSRGDTKETIWKRTSRQISEAKEELYGVYDETIILSGEDGCVLSSESMGRLRRFLHDIIPGPVKTEVLLYVRDPVSYVESAVQENVKGNGMTLEASKDWHIAASSSRYEKIVQHCLSSFSRNEISVRSFEDCRKLSAGVTEDFANFCGFSLGGITAFRENNSIADEVVRILSEINRREVAVCANDRGLLMKLPGQHGTLLDVEDVRAILSLAASDLEFLEKSFGISYRRRSEGMGHKSKDFSEVFIIGLREVLSQFEAGTRDIIKRVARLP